MFSVGFNFVKAHIQVVNPILFVDVHQTFVGMLPDNLLECLAKLIPDGTRPVDDVPVILE